MAMKATKVKEGLLDAIHDITTSRSTTRAPPGGPQGADGGEDPPSLMRKDPRPG